MNVGISSRKSLRAELIRDELAKDTPRLENLVQPVIR